MDDVPANANKDCPGASSQDAGKVIFFAKY